MILNMIVSSTWEELGNLCPSVAMVTVSFHYDFIFSFSPFTSLDLWVKVVVPSLSALFANSAR